MFKAGVVVDEASPPALAVDLLDSALPPLPAVDQPEVSTAFVDGVVRLTC